MRRLRVLVLRLRAIFRSRASDADLDRELALHFDQLVREQVAAGLDEAAARRAARRAFGSVDATREQCRDARRIGLLEDLIKDTTYGLRTLRRSPGFTCTAVLSLALGIGANTAIFSLVDAVLLRTLPVQRPGELVFLEVVGSDSRRGAPPYPCFDRIRQTTTAFAGMSAFATDELRVEVDGALEQVFGQVASGNYFEVLGVKPAIGRLLTEADDRLEPPVAVIGDGYWQRRFGGDPGVLGKRIGFGDRTYAIVGVTPAGFSGLQPGRHVDLTLPITGNPAMLADAHKWWFDAVARVRADASIAQAAAQADSVFQAFMNERTQSGEMRRQHSDRLQLGSAGRGMDRLRARFSVPLRVLSAIGAIVLLIACANLAGLLVARGESRAREMAIRMATGAGTARLLRQLLTETLLLFLIGMAAGLLVALATVRGLAGFFAIGRNPILLDIHYDWRLAAFTGGVALVAGLLTGVWPAVRALSAAPHAAMKQAESRLAGSRRSTIVGRVLVSGQMAMSLILLIAAVLLVRTMANLRAVDLGFNGGHVLTMSLDLVVPPGSPAGMRVPYFRRVLGRVRALHGVRAASLSVLTPLSGRDTGQTIAVAGYEPSGLADRTVRLNHVSDDYFRTFRIDLVAGRAFTPRDAEGTLKVAVVNQTAARTYFAGRNPVGETITLGDAAAYQVVGVVGDHKHRSVREPSARFVFVPVWQPVDPVGRVTLAVSYDRPVAEVTRAVAGEVHAVYSRILVSDVIDVQRQIDATLVGERLLSRLAGGFAVLALALATIGLYGILSFSVARRRTEFGVRMALGARPVQVAAAVYRQVLVPVAAGIGVGLPAAVLVSRMAEALLFGVRPLDPFSYLVAAAILTLVAAAAAWLPARRAYAIQPSEALRWE